MWWVAVAVALCWGTFLFVLATTIGQALGGPDGERDGYGLGEDLGLDLGDGTAGDA